MRFNMTFVYRLSNFESTQAEADAEAQLELISLVCAVNVAISTYLCVSPCVCIC